MNQPYDQRYTEYQTDRSRFRKYVRRAYLKSAAAMVTGPTIDFGCGIGELLQRLPTGSLGLEVNQATVQHCTAIGLEVMHYDANVQGWDLAGVPSSLRMRSLVISHVLEHLEDPVGKFRKLLAGCEERGITTVLVIVPGVKGYATDPTHLTFLDRSDLHAPEVVHGTGFRIDRSEYFPVDSEWFGKYFTHNELRVRFVLAP